MLYQIGGCDECGGTCQSGDGLMRDPTINPPAVRKLLSQVGNEKVESLQLIREPLSTLSKTLLNVLSGGNLEQYMKEAGVDKLFHLSLLINGKYTLEKNQVINMKQSEQPDLSKVESLVVPVGGDFTINEMIANTQKQMGDKYGPYDAQNNNCSIFVKNVLSANNSLTRDADTFLSQPAEEIASKFPSIAKIIGKAVTDTAGVVDKVIQGEGSSGSKMKHEANTIEDIDKDILAFTNEYNHFVKSAEEADTDEYYRKQMKIAKGIMRKIEELEYKKKRMKGFGSSEYFHNFGLPLIAIKF
jgi:hypothetical protein